MEESWMLLSKWKLLLSFFLFLIFCSFFSLKEILIGFVLFFPSDLFPPFSFLFLPFFRSKVWWARNKENSGFKRRHDHRWVWGLTGVRDQVIKSGVGYTGNVLANNYTNDNGHWLLTVREEIYKYGSSEGRLISVVLGWTWRH